MMTIVAIAGALLMRKKAATVDGSVDTEEKPISEKVSGFPFEHIREPAAPGYISVEERTHRRHQRIREDEKRKKELEKESLLKQQKTSELRNVDLIFEQAAERARFLALNDRNRRRGFNLER